MLASKPASEEPTDHLVGVDELSTPTWSSSLGARTWHRELFATENFGSYRGRPYLLRSFR